MFCFHFSNAVDMYCLVEGPWNLRGAVLILEETSLDSGHRNPMTEIPILGQSKNVSTPKISPLLTLEGFIECRMILAQPLSPVGSGKFPKVADGVVAEVLTDKIEQFGIKEEVGIIGPVQHVANDFNAGLRVLEAYPSLPLELVFLLLMNAINSLQIIADGATFSAFMNAWSRVAACGSSEVVHNPSITGRSLFPPNSSVLCKWPFKASGKNEYVTTRFVFDGAALAALKAQAASISHVRYPTLVDAVAALIWGCVIEAISKVTNEDITMATSETNPESGPVSPDMQHSGGTVYTTPYVAPAHGSVGLGERPEKFNGKDFKR
ncbi:hypothetical protein RJ639_020396 [Escallonia herrerae]|uniref:Uncharacterized protein n=1 Tax=Escallonia herrerae TaxID=1293975 RepID=A0AA89AHC7_9ASTE|nr:hypothetical protein RJ639_020396 [Escallonia herrerae]